MHLCLLTTAMLSLALLDCPASPNCVSSQAADPDRRVQPLAYPPGQDQLARKTLLQVLRDLPRATITEQSPTVITAVVHSALFRFKDDLDFHFDHQAGLIHVRSAARTGYWDLGVNRRRVEHIRSRFNTLLNTPGRKTS